MQSAYLTSPANLADLLRRHGFHTKKRFGQNFLVDNNVLAKILDSASIREGDPVLEIGPGVGTLTLASAEKGARVLAVEMDRELIPILSETLSNSPDARIVNADILSLSLRDLLRDHFGSAKVKVLGNLPYYITSPIIGNLLDVCSQLDRIVLMVQKEVAERLMAAPGTKDYGSMSVFVQYHTAPEIIAHVSRNVFFPPPDVSSAIVRLVPRAHPPVDVPNERLYFDIVHCAFGQRRKTLLNSLSDCPVLGLTKQQVSQVLREAAIDPSRRAETLSLEEFGRIARALSVDHPRS